jgi:hypothetical protein
MYNSISDSSNPLTVLTSDSSIIEVPHYNSQVVNRELRRLSEYASNGYKLTPSDFLAISPMSVFYDMLYRGRLESNYATAFYANLCVRSDKSEALDKHLPTFFTYPRSRKVCLDYLRRIFTKMVQLRTLVPSRTVNMIDSPGFFTFIHPAIMRKICPNGLAVTVEKERATYTPQRPIMDRQRKRAAAKRRKQKKNESTFRTEVAEREYLSFEPNSPPFLSDPTLLESRTRMFVGNYDVQHLIQICGDLYHCRETTLDEFSRAFSYLLFLATGQMLPLSSVFLEQLDTQDFFHLFCMISKEYYNLPDFALQKRTNPSFVPFKIEPICHFVQNYNDSIKKTDSDFFDTLKVYTRQLSEFLEVIYDGDEVDEWIGEFLAKAKVDLNWVTPPPTPSQTSEEIWENAEQDDTIHWNVAGEDETNADEVDWEGIEWGVAGENGIISEDDDVEQEVLTDGDAHYGLEEIPQHYRWLAFQRRGLTICPQCESMETLGQIEKLCSLEYQIQPPDEVNPHYTWHSGTASLHLCCIYTIAQEFFKEEPNFENFVAMMMHMIDPGSITAHGGAFSMVKDTMAAIADFSSMATAIKTFFLSCKEKLSLVGDFVKDWAPTIVLVALIALVAVIKYTMDADASVTKMLLAFSGITIAMVSLFVVMDAAVMVGVSKLLESATTMFSPPGLISMGRNAAINRMRGIPTDLGPLTFEVDRRNRNSVFAQSRAIVERARQEERERRYAVDDTFARHFAQLDTTALDNAVYTEDELRRMADLDGSDDEVVMDRIITGDAHGGNDRFDCFIGAFRDSFDLRTSFLHLSYLRSLYLAAKDITGIARFFFELLPVTIQSLGAKKYPQLLTSILYHNSRWKTMSLTIAEYAESLKNPTSKNVAAATRFHQEAKKYLDLHCSEGWANHAEKELSDFKTKITSAEGQVKTILFARKPLMISLTGAPQIGKTLAGRQLCYFLGACFSGQDRPNLTYDVPPEKFWENYGDAVGCYFPELFGSTDLINQEQVATYMALADGNFKPAGASIERKDQYLDVAYCVAASNYLYPTAIPTFKNYSALWPRTNIRVLVYRNPSYCAGKMVGPEFYNYLNEDPRKCEFPHLLFALVHSVPPSPAQVENYNANLQGPINDLICPTHKAGCAALNLNSAALTFTGFIKYVSILARERAQKNKNLASEQFAYTKDLLAQFTEVEVRPFNNDWQPNNLGEKDHHILRTILAFAIGAPLVGLLAYGAKHIWDAYKATSVPLEAHYGGRPRGPHNLQRAHQQQIAQARMVSSQLTAHSKSETPNPVDVFVKRVVDGQVRVIYDNNSVYGFLLDAQTVVVPSHLFKDSNGEWKYNKFVTVRYNLAGNQMETQVFIESNTLKIPDRNNDLAILRLLIKIPEIRICGKRLSYFCENKDAAIMGKLPGRAFAAFAKEIVPGTAGNSYKGMTYNNFNGRVGATSIFISYLTTPLTAGDCGAIAWGFPNGQPKIIGFYVGGTPNGESFFARLSSEELFPYLNVSPSDEMYMAGPEESIAIFAHMGEDNPSRYTVSITEKQPSSPDPALPPLFQIDKMMSNPKNTKMKPTVFKDAFPDFPCRVAPANLDPKLIFNQEAKYGIRRNPMPESLLRKAEAAVDLLYPAPVLPLKEWSLEMAVNSVPADASVGFGWTCKRKDLMPLVDDEMGAFHLPALDLVASVSYITGLIDSGIIPMTVILPCMKDETRTLKKVREGLTRTFQISPIEQLILGTQVLGDFMDYLHKQCLTTPSTVGIDPASREWHIVFNHLFSVHKYQKLVDLDYKSMEATELWQVFESYLRFTTRYYKDYGTTTWKRRYAYLLMMCQSMMVVGKNCWYRDHGNPSGMKGTSDFNTYVASLFSAYAFFDNFPECQPSDFKQLVRCVFNGDDTILCIHPSIQDRFHFTAVEASLAKLNVVITPAKKDEAVQDFVLPVDVQFCKKQILWSDELWGYVPFVTFHTLLDQLSYTKDPSPEGLVQILNSALQWSFFRGNMRDNGDMPVTEPTFNEQRRMLMSLLPAGQEQIFDYETFRNRFLNPRLIPERIEEQAGISVLRNERGLRQIVVFPQPNTIMQPKNLQHCAIAPHDEVAETEEEQEMEIDLPELWVNAHFGINIGPFHLGVGDDLHGPTNPSPTPVSAPTDTQPPGIESATTQIIEVAEEFLGAVFAHSGPEPTDLIAPAAPVAATVIDNVDADQAKAIDTKKTAKEPGHIHNRTVPKVEADPLAEKWYQLSKDVINSASPGTNLQNWNLPIDVIKGPAAMQVVKGRYFSCDFVFRFVVTTGAFSGGKMFAVFVPYGYATTALSLMRITSLPHIEIDVASNQPQELMVPYSYILDYFSLQDMYQQVVPTMGNVILWFQDVQNPVTSAKPVTVITHVSIRNLKTYVPINIPPCCENPLAAYDALTAPSEEIYRNVVPQAVAHSGPAQAIRNGELFAPAFDDGQPTVILGDKSTGTHHGTSDHSQITLDECSHAFFAHKPVIISVDSCLDGAGEAEILLKQDMSPRSINQGATPIADGHTPYEITPLEYLYYNHMMWHGGQRFRHELVGPREITVRMAYTFLYGQFPTEAPNFKQAIQYPTIYHTFDSTHRDFFFECPDVNPHKWKIRSDLVQQENDLYHADPQPRTSNGTIFIWQVTSVSGINVPLTKAPYFNLWKCASSDFQVNRFSPCPGMSFDRHIDPPFARKESEFEEVVVGEAHVGGETQKPDAKAPSTSTFQAATSKKKPVSPKQQNSVTAVSPLVNMKIPKSKMGSFADQFNRPVIFKSSQILLAKAGTIGSRYFENLPCMLINEADNTEYIPGDMFNQLSTMFMGWSGDAVYDVVINCSNNNGSVGTTFGTIVYDSAMDSDNELNFESLVSELPAPYLTGDFYPNTFGATLPTNSQVVASQLPLSTAQVPSKFRVIVPYINPVRYSNVKPFSTTGTLSYRPMITGFLGLWNNSDEEVSLYVTIFRHAAPGARLHHFVGVPTVYFDRLRNVAGAKLNYPGENFALE